jgi:anaerobic dimethyl sulfoxide reductase subunit B (iron-sulfur subunit)
MAQNGFYFDSSRCTGCKTCELACKDYKDLGTEILFRKIYDYEGGEWTQGADGTWSTSAFAYHVSLACNHCAMPACLAVCPVEAIVKDGDNGLVTIDAELCIGCGSCLTACPYEAPKLDAATTKVRKCDGCFDRVAEGRQPICVEACPLRALEFDDLELLRSKYGDLAQVPPLPDPNQTAPSLVIKPCPAVESPAIARGFIANEKEVA